MPYLPSLPEGADLRDLAAAFAEPYARLREFGERLMYGPSPFSLGERELIAGYVSGLNACGFCHGIHAEVARNHGIEEGLMAALLGDVGDAPVDDRWKALLGYMGKLTREPAKATQTDVEALYDAGWSERAVLDAVLVCAYFNMLNRLVDGVGIHADADSRREAARRIAEEACAGAQRFAGE